MVYRVDNRPKKHQGRILILGIFLGIAITVGGYYWFENTPNLIRMAGQVSTNVTNISEYNSGLHALQKITNQVKSLTQPQSQPQTTDLHSIAMQIHDLVNKERIANGLSELSWNEKISQVGVSYSQYMLVNNHYDHIDLNGNHADYRMAQSGVTCSYWGENLDWIGGNENTFTPNEILNDWMSDEGHKANLLNPSFTEEGIGVFSSNSQTYITEDFCLSS